MRFLVIYATTEGHTRKVAEHVADRLHALDQLATMYDATDDEPDVELVGVDGVFVAASLYEDRFQEGIATFVTNRREALNRIVSIFLPVSLSAASSDADDRASLYGTIDRFIVEKGWRPSHIHHVKGALKCSNNDFFRRWSRKLLVRDGSIATGLNLELTDWMALTDTVDTLVCDLDLSRQPSVDLVLPRGKGAKAIDLHKPHAIRAGQCDETLASKRGQSTAHRLHR